MTPKYIEQVDESPDPQESKDPFLEDDSFYELDALLDDEREYRWLEMSYYKYANTDRWDTEPDDLSQFYDNNSEN